MNLGNLIETLEALPATYDVKYDDGRVPQGFESWRGVYAELTMPGPSYRDGKERVTVGELLGLARKANGGTFEGYKGGDFVMGLHTPVWADDYGDCYYRGIVGTRVADGTVVIATADLSDYR